MIRRVPERSFMPVFTPPVGAFAVVTATAAAAASAGVAIPLVDTSKLPFMMSIRAPSGGRCRIAFGTDSSILATASSMLLGFTGLSDWETQIGIPEGATHYSVIRADGTNVSLELIFC